MSDLIGQHGSAKRPEREVVHERPADMSDEAGHGGLADEITEVLVGRDVINGCWTFQLVEDYDAGYWTVFRDVEGEARQRLGAVEPHVYEAEMKKSEQA